MTDNGDLAILVIEDNPGDFTLVEDFLIEQLKSPVITLAKDFREAKALLLGRGSDFNVILLDLSLPDKTGSELIEEMVHLSSNAPVIVLTGYSDLSFGVRSISRGISDYLLKDELTPLTLHKTILYSLERKKIVASLEESEKRVRSFAKQLSHAIEEERSRIAREIHDEFGQQLSGIKMSLSALKNAHASPMDIGPVIETIVGEVNNSIQSLRQISNELRPSLLDKLGLFAAVEWLVTEFRKKTGIESHFNAVIAQPEFSKDVEINIFRICQEALTNITKHAGATLVTIKMEVQRNELHIAITDNGKGIQAGILRDPLSSGLLNMRERAALMGAEINISSPENKGTRIELIVNQDGEKDIDS